MGTQMSVETGAKSAIPLRCAPNSQPFRNCSSDKSDSFAEAEAYHSFYRKLAQRHFNSRAPEGCNTAQATTRRSLSSFNPRAPRGTRLAVRHMFVALPPFQPTRPAWGATPSFIFDLFPLAVSTHAPREGRDCHFMHNSESNCMIYAIFQATSEPSQQPSTQNDSIHARTSRVDPHSLGFAH